MKSGRQLSPAAAQLRSIILDLVEENPGITGREITIYSAKMVPVDRWLVKNTMKALISDEEIAQEHINSRLIKYSIKTSGIDQIIRLIPANQAPRMPGAIYSPMAWCLNQLRG